MKFKEKVKKPKVTGNETARKAYCQIFRPTKQISKAPRAPPPMIPTWSKAKQTVFSSTSSNDSNNSDSHSG